MFKLGDIVQIEARGCRPETIQRQIENFKSGFPMTKLIEAASISHGIALLSDGEKQHYQSVFSNCVSSGLEIKNFIPASGAASRMFLPLFSALNQKEESAIVENTDVQIFLNNLSRFAFYDDLKELLALRNRSIDELFPSEILEYVLFEHGLNYGNLPKGLLKFHIYPDGCRTSLEEHLVESALYAKTRENEVNLHLTVSSEHQALFEKHIHEIKSSYEQLLGVTYRIHFTLQNPSTDILAVTPDNEPFRNEDGSLLFRPAGHGALLENLNELDADLIFIKNIDNVVPDSLKDSTIESKKILAGLILDLQQKIFYYQKMLNENSHHTLAGAFYAEAYDFLTNVLLTKAPKTLNLLDKENIHRYLKQKFDRPLRVCGMVRNLGEPGGGPFFVQNTDGTVSLHIVESSQINYNDPEQAAIALNSTHFNPVDLVCAVRNYFGEKYDLTKFCDPLSGFITTKSKDGKVLKTQELPGLWNGSMSDWNTLFVEVPVETFNPVKTVNDLLRKEHHTKNESNRKSILKFANF